MRNTFTALVIASLTVGCSSQDASSPTAEPAADTTPAAAGPDSAAVDASAAPPASAPTTESADESQASADATPDSGESSTPLVIDVRTQAEWDEGHLDIATHIPLAEIEDRIAEVAPDRDQQVYLHCRSGGRSGQAKLKLEALGYTNVENVGGLKDARARFKKDQD